MTIERYNYNDEPSGRSDTLVQALDKIERLEKKLVIATSALSGMRFQMSVSQCIWLALDALNKIKEIDKQLKL